MLTRNPALALVVVLSTASSAQTDILYITDGDSARLTAIQNGAVLWTNTSYVRAYPIVVRNSIWLADYNQSGMTAREYDLNGMATGQQRNWNAPRGVDGGTDGTDNFLLESSFGSTAIIARYDGEWQNRQQLFTINGSDLVGLTHDTATDTLWMSDRNNIYHYSLGGAPLGQFPQSNGRGCLAYEESTDTLWHVRNGAVNLHQYDKQGSLLQNMSAPTSSNYWGAEFRIAGGGVQIQDVTGIPAQVAPGSAGNQLSVTLANTHMTETVDSINITLSFTGTADRTPEYTPTPDPANPTTITRPRSRPPGWRPSSTPSTWIRARPRRPSPSTPMSARCSIPAGARPWPAVRRRPIPGTSSVPARSPASSMRFPRSSTRRRPAPRSASTSRTSA
jgi:hypothetical protein